MDRSGAIVVGVLAAAVLGAAIVLSVSMPPSSPTWRLLVPAVVVLFVLALVAPRLVRRWRSTSASRVRPAAVAARLGLSYEAKPESETVARRLAALPQIPGRGGTIKHLMTGERRGRRAMACQHTYVIHTGQASIPVSHTIYAVSAPGWPALHVRPRRGFGRLLRRLGWRRGIELDSAAFNRAFHVQCAEEDFAITLLSPELQAYLVEKRGAAWHVVDGAIHLVYGGAMSAARVEASWERLDRFCALVAPELEAWAPAPETRLTAPGPSGTLSA